MSNFEQWWNTEGSAMRPYEHEDIEEFAKRITQIAWSNGEFVEREACAKVCEEYNFGQAPALIQSRIRARGQQ